MAGDRLEQSSSLFPKLPGQFQYLIKQPRMVKNALIAACNFLMAGAGVKLGNDTFLAWHFPIEKALLVHTSGLVNKVFWPVYEIFDIYSFGILGIIW